MSSFLIVNADDLGLCEGVNAAVVEAAVNGTVSSASSFALPGFKFDPGPLIDLGVRIGIHFSFNFGTPASPAERLRTLVSGGIFKTDGHENADPDEIRTELLAQYELFCRNCGFPPAHMNFHKHLNEKVPAVQEAAMDLAGKFSLPMRSMGPEARRIIKARGIATNDHFLGDVSNAPYWTVGRLAEELAQLPDGVTELMCHPGRNLGKIKGLWYLEQRDVEADTFASERAREIILRYRR